MVCAVREPSGGERHHAPDAGGRTGTPGIGRSCQAVRPLTIKATEALPTTNDMTSRELIILAGLALAAWGHLLVHELFGMATAWIRIDDRFPPAWRSSPTFAGACLLGVGALCVLVPTLG